MYNYIFDFDGVFYLFQVEADSTTKSWLSDSDAETVTFSGDSDVDLEIAEKYVLV